MYQCGGVTGIHQVVHQSHGVMWWWRWCTLYTTSTIMVDTMYTVHHLHLSWSQVVYTVHHLHVVVEVVYTITLYMVVDHHITPSHCDVVVHLVYSHTITLYTTSTTTSHHHTVMWWSTIISHHHTVTVKVEVVYQCHGHTITLVQVVSTSVMVTCGCGGGTPLSMVSLSHHGGGVHYLHGVMLWWRWCKYHTVHVVVEVVYQCDHTITLVHHLHHHDGVMLWWRWCTV